MFIQVLEVSTGIGIGTQFNLMLIIVKLYIDIVLGATIYLQDFCDMPIVSNT